MCVNSWYCTCHCIFCHVKPKEIRRVRVDYTKETHGVDAHGYAIEEIVYWPGGSRICMIGFEPDK